MSEITYYVALPFVPSEDGIAPAEPVECFNPNKAAVAEFKPSERSLGIENACYVLKAILDPKTSAPPFETEKDYFNWIMMRLEELFPANRAAVPATQETSEASQKDADLPNAVDSGRPGRRHVATHLYKVPYPCPLGLLRIEPFNLASRST
jgi:hypothetical protein